MEVDGGGRGKLVVEDDLHTVAKLHPNGGSRNHLVVGPRRDGFARRDLPLDDRSGQLELLRPVSQDPGLQDLRALPGGLGREGLGDGFVLGGDLRRRQRGRWRY